METPFDQHDLSEQDKNEATALQIQRIAGQLGEFSLTEEGHTLLGNADTAHIERGRTHLEHEARGNGKTTILTSTIEGVSVAFGPSKPGDPHDFREHITRTRKTDIEVVPAENPRYGDRKAYVTGRTTLYRQEFGRHETRELTTAEIRSKAAEILLRGRHHTNK